MTTTELELKTKRFTAKMNDKQLAKLHEIIEDIRDARLADQAWQRIKSGKSKLVPLEEVEAHLEKKWGVKFN